MVRLKEAAVRLGVSYNALRSMAKAGRIPAVRTEISTPGKGTWMVDVERVKNALIQGGWHD